MASSRKRGSGRKLSLEAKKRPEQQRATDTYEHILDVAASMLGDVGIERLSTNTICKRAGLTPPALYRYFPNKYAVLTELGNRLMEQQNRLIPHWITPDVLSGSGGEVERALEGLLLDTYRVTKETPGGVWILRTLRAVPTLQDIRLDSHANVTQAQIRLLEEAFPGVPRQELMLVGRIVVDMIYAAVELLFDVPLDKQAVARVVAAMIASHLERLRAADG
jgi:AcrR family transcriptional regulator